MDFFQRPNFQINLEGPIEMPQEPPNEHQIHLSLAQVPTRHNSYVLPLRMSSPFTFTLFGMLFWPFFFLLVTIIFLYDFNLTLYSPGSCNSKHFILDLFNLCPLQGDPLGGNSSVEDTDAIRVTDLNSSYSLLQHLFSTPEANNVTSPLFVSHHDINLVADASGEEQVPPNVPYYSKAHPISTKALRGHYRVYIRPLIQNVVVFPENVWDGSDTDAMNEKKAHTENRAQKRPKGVPALLVSFQMLSGLSRAIKAMSTSTEPQLDAKTSKEKYNTIPASDTLCVHPSSDSQPGVYSPSAESQSYFQPTYDNIKKYPYCFMATHYSAVTAIRAASFVKSYTGPTPTDTVLARRHENGSAVLLSKSNSPSFASSNSNLNWIANANLISHSYCAATTTDDDSTLAWAQVLDSVYELLYFPEMDYEGSSIISITRLSSLCRCVFNIAFYISAYVLVLLQNPECRILIFLSLISIICTAIKEQIDVILLRQISKIISKTRISMLFLAQSLLVYATVKETKRLYLRTTEENERIEDDHEELDILVEEYLENAASAAGGGKKSKKEYKGRIADVKQFFSSHFRSFVNLLYKFTLGLPYYHCFLLVFILLFCSVIIKTAHHNMSIHQFLQQPYQVYSAQIRKHTLKAIFDANAFNTGMYGNTSSIVTTQQFVEFHGRTPTISEQEVILANYHRSRTPAHVVRSTYLYKKTLKFIRKKSVIDAVMGTSIPYTTNLYGDYLPDRRSNSNDQINKGTASGMEWEGDNMNDSDIGVGAQSIVEVPTGEERNIYCSDNTPTCDSSNVRPFPSPFRSLLIPISPEISNILADAEGHSYTKPGDSNSENIYKGLDEAVSLSLLELLELSNQHVSLSDEVLSDTGIDNTTKNITNTVSNGLGDTHGNHGNKGRLLTDHVYDIEVDVNTVPAPENQKKKHQSKIDCPGQFFMMCTHVHQKTSAVIKHLLPPAEILCPPRDVEYMANDATEEKRLLAVYKGFLSTPLESIPTVRQVILPTVSNTKGISSHDLLPAFYEPTALQPYFAKLGEVPRTTRVAFRHLLYGVWNDLRSLFFHYLSVYVLLSMFSNVYLQMSNVYNGGRLSRMKNRVTAHLAQVGFLTACGMMLLIWVQYIVPLGFSHISPLIYSMLSPSSSQGDASLYLNATGSVSATEQFTYTYQHISMTRDDKAKEAYASEAYLWTDLIPQLAAFPILFLCVCTMTLIIDFIFLFNERYCFFTQPTQTVAVGVLFFISRCFPIFLRSTGKYCSGFYWSSLSNSSTNPVCEDRHADGVVSEKQSPSSPSLSSTTDSGANVDGGQSSRGGLKTMYNILGRSLTSCLFGSIQEEINESPHVERLRKIFELNVRRLLNMVHDLETGNTNLGAEKGEKMHLFNMRLRIVKRTKELLHILELRTVVSRIISGLIFNDPHISTYFYVVFGYVLLLQWISIMLLPSWSLYIMMQVLVVMRMRWLPLLAVDGMIVQSYLATRKGLPDGNYDNYDNYEAQMINKSKFYLDEENTDKVIEDSDSSTNNVVHRENLNKCQEKHTQLSSAAASISYHTIVKKVAIKRYYSIHPEEQSHTEEVASLHNNNSSKASIYMGGNTPLLPRCESYHSEVCGDSEHNEINKISSNNSILPNGRYYHYISALPVVVFQGVCTIEPILKKFNFFFNFFNRGIGMDIRSRLMEPYYLLNRSILKESTLGDHSQVNILVGEYQDSVSRSDRVVNTTRAGISSHSTLLHEEKTEIENKRNVLLYNPFVQMHLATHRYLPNHLVRDTFYDCNFPREAFRQLRLAMYHSNKEITCLMWGITVYIFTLQLIGELWRWLTGPLRGNTSHLVDTESHTLPPWRSMVASPSPDYQEGSSSRPLGVASRSLKRLLKELSTATECTTLSSVFHITAPFDELFQTLLDVCNEQYPFLDKIVKDDIYWKVHNQQSQSENNDVDISGEVLPLLVLDRIEEVDILVSLLINLLSCASKDHFALERLATSIPFLRCVEMCIQLAYIVGAASPIAGELIMHHPTDRYRKIVRLWPTYQLFVHNRQLIRKCTAVEKLNGIDVIATELQTPVTSKIINLAYMCLTQSTGTRGSAALFPSSLLDPTCGGTSVSEGCVFYRELITNNPCKYKNMKSDNSVKRYQSTAAGSYNVDPSSAATRSYTQRSAPNSPFLTPWQLPLMQMLKRNIRFLWNAYTGYEYPLFKDLVGPIFPSYTLIPIEVDINQSVIDPRVGKFTHYLVNISTPLPDTEEGHLEVRGQCGQILGVYLNYTRQEERERFQKEVSASMSKGYGCRAADGFVLRELWPADVAEAMLDATDLKNSLWLSKTPEDEENTHGLKFEEDVPWDHRQKEIEKNKADLRAKKNDPKYIFRRKRSDISALRVNKIGISAMVAVATFVFAKRRILDSSTHVFNSASLKILRSFALLSVEQQGDDSCIFQEKQGFPWDNEDTPTIEIPAHLAPPNKTIIQDPRIRYRPYNHLCSVVSVLSETLTLPVSPVTQSHPGLWLPQQFRRRGLPPPILESYSLTSLVMTHFLRNAPCSTAIPQIVTVDHLLEKSLLGNSLSMWQDLMRMLRYGILNSIQGAPLGNRLFSQSNLVEYTRDIYDKVLFTLKYIHESFKTLVYLARIPHHACKPFECPTTPALLRSRIAQIGRTTQFAELMSEFKRAFLPIVTTMNGAPVSIIHQNLKWNVSSIGTSTVKEIYHCRYPIECDEEDTQQETEKTHKILTDFAMETHLANIDIFCPIFGLPDPFIICPDDVASEINRRVSNAPPNTVLRKLIKLFPSMEVKPYSSAALSWKEELQRDKDGISLSGGAGEELDEMEEVFSDTTVDRRKTASALYNIISNVVNPRSISEERKKIANKEKTTVTQGEDTPGTGSLFSSEDDADVALTYLDVHRVMMVMCMMHPSSPSYKIANRIYLRDLVCDTLRWMDELLHLSTLSVYQNGGFVLTPNLVNSDEKEFLSNYEGSGRTPKEFSNPSDKSTTPYSMCDAFITKQAVEAAERASCWALPSESLSGTIIEVQGCKSGVQSSALGSGDRSTSSRVLVARAEKRESCDNGKNKDVGVSYESRVIAALEPVDRDDICVICLEKLHNSSSITINNAVGAQACSATWNAGGSQNSNYREGMPSLSWGCNAPFLSFSELQQLRTSEELNDFEAHFELFNEMTHRSKEFRFASPNGELQSIPTESYNGQDDICRKQFALGIVPLLAPYTELVSVESAMKASFLQELAWRDLSQKRADVILEIEMWAKSRIEDFPLEIQKYNRGRRNWFISEQEMIKWVWSRTRSFWYDDLFSLVPPREPCVCVPQPPDKDSNTSPFYCISPLRKGRFLDHYHLLEKQQELTRKMKYMAQQCIPDSVMEGKAEDSVDTTISLFKLNGHMMFYDRRRRWNDESGVGPMRTALAVDWRRDVVAFWAPRIPHLWLLLETYNMDPSDVNEKDGTTSRSLTSTEVTFTSNIFSRNDQVVTLLECGHRFHHKCLVDYFLQKPPSESKCLLCRQGGVPVMITRPLTK